MTSKTVAEVNAAAPHVLTAINAVMAALSLSGISKDRKNEQQGYKFRGIDEVYNTASSLFSEQKLLVLPRYANRVLMQRETKKGDPLFSVTVEGFFKLVSAVDGSEVDAGPFFGEAMDTADKATNKAMSAAQKYFVLQTFLVPTKGDNDADATTHEVNPRTVNAEELAAIRKELVELKIDEVLFVNSIKIEKLADLLASDITELNNLFAKKRKKLAEQPAPKKEAAANDASATDKAEG